MTTSLQGTNFRVKLAGSLLFSSGIVFMILNTVAEGLYPNYSVGINALSDLGAIGAPTRFLWDGMLFFAGSLSIIGMYVLFFKSAWTLRMGIRKGKVIDAVYLIPGIGSILVSLFPENSILAIHSLSAFATFVFGGFSALYSYRFTKSPFRYLALVLGIVSLASILLLVGASGSLGFFGLIERLIVYPFVLWEIAFGSYLLGQ